MASAGVSPAAIIQSVEWIGQTGGHLRLLDQTLLPGSLTYLDCHDVEQLWEAIKSLRVRGAPAIGIAAAYGVCLGAGKAINDTLEETSRLALAAVDRLATSRPTAVNLFWALERLQRLVKLTPPNQTGSELRMRLLLEAQAIQDEDRHMCRAIGEHGASLIPNEATLITHCNAGGLATAAYGTALSVMFSCQDHGKRLSVFVDETRPLWQGSRLTAWELMQRQIPATIICDSMAGHVMRSQKVTAVIVGADRITANGDVANKIGTYSLAVLAHHHGIPFYVAAPSSSFDLTLASGDQIPIEQRDAKEITEPGGIRVAPKGAQVFNPAFDVTPASLVTALITERGIIQPVTTETVARMLNNDDSV
ncbi:MAG: S-methyl-5-thioribose-1-phosphate isomerase [Pirellulaceae bacterium]|nr:S-methyl-5-thioribose-1-phosphate isomerase [Pirellulaceae bacterium]